MAKSYLGAALGAVADYFTGGLGGFTSLGAGLGSSADQQARSEAYASQNRDFQERMSSTAYQRQANDMRAAGMNPIAGYGSGASTPSGSVAQAMDLVTPGVSSALAVTRSRAEVENLEAQGENIRSQTALNHVMAEKAKEDVSVSANTLGTAEGPATPG